MRKQPKPLVQHHPVQGHIDFLGYHVKDRVTGLTGIVSSISFDLYGCVQALINPGLDQDMKFRELVWFDVKRLKITSEHPVMELPDFTLPEIGPENKPIP